MIQIENCDSHNQCVCKSEDINYLPFYFPATTREMNDSVTGHTRYQIANQIPYWCETEITQETSPFFLPNLCHRRRI